MFTHADYNAGNSFMADKEHGKAADCYFKVLQASGLKEVDSEKTGEVEPQAGLHFNSQSCYAHTWSNLAVIFLLLSIRQAQGFGEEVGSTDDAVKAAQTCIGKALKFMPADEGSEAYINMNNVMRQMGC